MKVQGSGVDAYGLGFRVQSSESRVSGLGFKVQGVVRFRVSGLRYRGHSLGFGVERMAFRVLG